MVISQYVFTVYPGFFSLRAGRSGDRIPVGAKYSAPIQTGPGVHPASCTVCTGSFPVGGGKAVVAWPPPSGPEVKQRVQVYLYSFLCHQDRLWDDLYTYFVK
jgi:hypothetical protein